MFGQGGVVVALDEEGLAEQAFHEAMGLGAALGQPVHAIHVVDTSPFFSVLGAMDLQSLLRPTIEALVQRWSEAGLPEGTASPEVEVLLGNPVKVLLGRARALKAALIVVGGHPSQRIGVGLGSTARRLVRAADRPVLVRRGAPSGGAILVPVDLSDESAVALELGVQLAKMREVPLITLYVRPPDNASWLRGVDVTSELVKHQSERHEAYQALVARIAGEIGPRVMYEHGEPRTVIADVGAAETVDLVVMGSHGLTGLARWSLGSVTEHILSRTELSVLSIKKSDRGFLLES